MTRFKLPGTIQLGFFFAVLFLAYGFTPHNYKGVPKIYFEEYGVEIRSTPYIGDTLTYKKSDNEYFKSVFYDKRGKCYCERYLQGKLYESGSYENSLDILKKYISGRYSSGKRTKIEVEEYYEPLKNGVWIILKNNQVIKHTYLMGIIQQ